MSSIKLKSNQKLKIKGRGLNSGSLFSKFEYLDDNDSDLILDNKIKKNTKQINNTAKIDNLNKQLNSTNDQIQKKKDIKANLIEIKNQTKSIKDATPIKNRLEIKSINDRLNAIRNLDKELSLNEDSTIQKKESIKNKLTNNDLYAKRISRKLNDANFSLIRFIVDQISPKKAFEFANIVLLDNELEKKNDLNRMESNFENSNSNLNKNEDMTGRIFTSFLKKSIEIDRSIDLNEKFIRLIIDDKNIPPRIKQAILDFKFKNQSDKNKSTNKSSKRVKLKRIKKKVDSINIDLGNLQLTTNPIKKNQDKKYDFK